MTGWLANQFGRKRLLLAPSPASRSASFCCGFAPSLALLIVFRIIQGIAGGALQPLSQAILLEMFPPAERGKAMAFWALGHRRGADARARARRLADRQLQLALDFLYQRAHWPARRGAHPDVRL